MDEKIGIIYADENFIVVNKPPGLAVHASRESFSQGRDKQITLIDFLLKKYPEMAGVGDDPRLRPGLVHRLDKDTSGVMVVARNQATFFRLKEIFKNRLVEKTYAALVCGLPKEKKGLIDLPIGRLVNNPLKRGVEKGRSRVRGAREARTFYRILKPGKDYSLLELKPQTGRMHQLRVHLKVIGHPVACDRVYGGKNICCPPGAGRQMLHAQSLSFSFPEGKKNKFEAEWPEDFARAVEYVK